LTVFDHEKNEKNIPPLDKRSAKTLFTP